jgi:hypothetical protein
MRRDVYGSRPQTATPPNQTTASDRQPAGAGTLRFLTRRPHIRPYASVYIKNTAICRHGKVTVAAAASRSGRTARFFMPVRFDMNLIWYVMNFIWRRINIIWRHMNFIWYGMNFIRYGVSFIRYEIHSIWYGIRIIWRRMNFIWYHMNFIRYVTASVCGLPACYPKIIIY